jgi:outer membrane cobalamin receptor
VLKDRSALYGRSGIHVRLCRVCICLLVSWPFLVGVVMAQETDFSASKSTGAYDQDFYLHDSLPAEKVAPMSVSTDVPSHFSYVFTEQDIRQSAARDLLELLNTVPSLSFGVDVAGSLTLGARGNLAGEFMALVIDGLVMNEGGYGTFQLAGKLNLGQILRIEVILGPHMLKVNNLAAYGAILIKTRASEPVTGIVTNWSQGFNNPSKDARVSSSLSVGQKGARWAGAVSASVNQSVLSFSPYTDAVGNTYDMSTNSPIYNRFVSAMVQYKGTSLTFLSDVYQISTRDAYGISTSQPYRNDFITYGVTLRHFVQVSSRLTLKGLLSFKSQDPFKALSEVAAGDSGFYYKYWLRAQRAVAQVNSIYTASDRLTLTFGLQGSADRGADLLKSEYYADDGYMVTYGNLTLIAHGIYRYKQLSLTGGARHEQHSYAGALTSFSASARQQVGAFYGRVGYSDMYRLPTLNNIDVASEGKEIQSAHIQTLDAEVGLHIKHVEVGFNYFRTITSEGIVYRPQLDGNEAYENVAPFGNCGGEAFIRGKFKHLKMNVGYMHYRNQVTRYGPNTFTAHESRANLGLPAHKVVASVHTALLKDLNLALFGIFESQKFGYVPSTSSVGPGGFTRYPAILTCNVMLSYHLGVANGLDITAGVADVFGSRILYVQPYSGGHLPLPGPAREYIIRVSYALIK